MGLPQSLVLLVESVHAVDHLLNELHLQDMVRMMRVVLKKCLKPYLRVAQPVFVGDVVGDASLTTRLSPCPTWLEREMDIKDDQ